MTVIKPFRAIRPKEHLISEVARLSMDFFNIAEKPNSEECQVDQAEEKLNTIDTMYHELIDGEYFHEEKKESLYLYQQFNGSDRYLGIIGCASVDDYLNGVIKIHEETITEHEERLLNYIEKCDFNSEPISIFYPDNFIIDQITQQIVLQKPIYHFKTEDGIYHTFWNILDNEYIDLICQEFGEMPKVYIADGHHRSASNACLCKKRRENKPDYSGDENFNSFMCVFYPESHLRIYDFNRVVKDLNERSPYDLLHQLKTKFAIEVIERDYSGPSKLHEMGMYLAGNWYKLLIKEDHFDFVDPVSALDAAILTDHILAPLLDIRDLRTDERIGFVPGIKGVTELQNQVDSGLMRLAFALFPASLDQLKLIADSNGIMPPKTTWIEPKQLSGFIIQSLS